MEDCGAEVADAAGRSRTAQRFARLAASEIHSRPGATASPLHGTSPAYPDGAQSHIARRPDIDGLRAVAVAAVVLFHWGFDPFGGGFVGVDVFFVISGYLIAATVLADLRRGAFSAWTFWERRARRIVPGLLGVALAAAAVSPFVFLPGDIGRVGDSIVSATLFVSNVFFLNIAGDYFEAGALALQPLLHTWSLSVEAQFYLLVPVFVIATRRLSGRTCAGLILAIALASLIVSVWGVFRYPAATFYLLPTRAWELLLGSLLALGLFGAPPSRRAAEALAALGLALILGAVFLYRETIPFPGASALVPCIGAALIIYAGEGGWERRTVVGRLLRTSPMTFVGRISYSIYLWHWPVLVVLRYGFDPLSPMGNLLAGAALLALSVLSWRYIEQPFLKRRKTPAGRRRSAAGFAAATVLSLGAGLVLHGTGKGLFSLVQLPAEVLQLANARYDRVTEDCRPSQGLAADAAPPCRFGAAGAPPKILLWGNSFARMWIPALDVAGVENRVSGIAAVLSRCPPFEVKGRAWCSAFNAEALATVQAHPSIEAIVLSANWHSYGNYAASLDETLSSLSQESRRIYVVLPPPGYSFEVPHALAMARLKQKPPPSPLRLEEHVTQQRALRAALEELREKHGFTIIDPTPALCEPAGCALQRDGRPLYYDAIHLSRFGAESVRPLFAPVFDR